VAVGERATVAGHIGPLADRRQTYASHRTPNQSARTGEIAKKTLRKHIERDETDYISVGPDSLDLDRDDIVEAAGFKLTRTDGVVEYCYLPQQFERALGGKLPTDMALRQLQKSKLLKSDGDGSRGTKSRPKRQLSRNWRPRVICVDAKILK